MLGESRDHGRVLDGAGPGACEKGSSPGLSCACGLGGLPRVAGYIATQEPG